MVGFLGPVLAVGGCAVAREGDAMSEAKTVRQHARDRGALGGADAQALEHALWITERERDEARAECVFLRLEIGRLRGKDV